MSTEIDKISVMFKTQDGDDVEVFYNPSDNNWVCVLNGRNKKYASLPSAKENVERFYRKEKKPKYQPFKVFKFIYNRWNSGGSFPLTLQPKILSSREESKQDSDVFDYVHIKSPGADKYTRTEVVSLLRDKSLIYDSEHNTEVVRKYREMWDGEEALLREIKGLEDALKRKREANEKWLSENLDYLKPMSDFEWEALSMREGQKLVKENEGVKEDV